MSRGNKWIPMDQYLAQDFKSIKRPFSRIEAMFSYTLDQDKGHSGSISGYASLWSWSRNKVRRFINSIRTVEGHLKDSKRTAQGHPIHFIDKALMGKKDSQRTVEGQSRDSRHDTTIQNNPKTKTKEEKNIQKKKSPIPTKTDLKEKIIEHNFIENKDKIFEFFEYRMSMPASKRYKTKKGLNALFRDLNGCRNRGLIISDCIDEAIEREWQTPKPDYFKNKPTNGNQNNPLQGTNAEKWLKSKGVL